ncbi:MAG: archaeosortase/exosortase family protein [Terriglobales bacterium]
MSRRSHVEFALLIAFSFAFWRAPLAQTFRLAFSNEAYTHIILIIPLSLALAWFDWQTLRPAIQPRRLGGLFLLTGALVLGCFARWPAGLTSAGLTPLALTSDVRLSLSMFAFVTWCVASVVVCFGSAVFRALVFPLCFLFWLVPFPDFLLTVIIVSLQNGSASAARWLFEAARVPVTQNGILLSIPGLDIEVARECSSVRSSMVLIVTTMVLAHLFLQSWWREVLLVLVAIPLSIAKNALRIFVIVELATHVNPEYLHGSLHRRGGIVFLTVALGGIVILLWLLARSEIQNEG